MRSLARVSAGVGVMSRLSPPHRALQWGGSSGTRGTDSAERGARMQAKCPHGFPVRDDPGAE